eukprot:666910-Amphidinium_carterae.1
MGEAAARKEDYCKAELEEVNAKEMANESKEKGTKTTQRRKNLNQAKQRSYMTPSLTLRMTL